MIKICSIRLCVLVLLLYACAHPDERIKPSIGTVTESVYASVTLQPDSLYQAYSVVGGIVQRILVKEGDQVGTGTPILQIKNTNPKLSMENAALALEQARKNYEGRANILRELRENIEVARINLKQDSLDYIRQKNLWDKNVGTQTAYDRRKLAYEVSRKNVKTLLNQYDRTEEELQNAFQQARNNYEATRNNTRDYTVTSKINGTVYDLYKEKGEIVNTQQPVAAIGSNEKFLIEALIDEKDIARVKKGQQMAVVLDAYGDSVFQARITRIYPQKNEQTQTFRVEAEFIHPPEVLYPGLSGEANILITTRKHALTIPRNYLMSGDRVRTEDGLVDVRTGLANMDRVEILAGLDTATYLLKPE